MSKQKHFLVTDYEDECLKKLCKATGAPETHYMRIGLGRILKENKCTIEAVELEKKEDKEALDEHL